MKKYYVLGEFNNDGVVTHAFVKEIIIYEETETLFILTSTEENALIIPETHKQIIETLFKVEKIPFSFIEIKETVTYQELDVDRNNNFIVKEKGSN